MDWRLLGFVRRSVSSGAKSSGAQWDGSSVKIKQRLKKDPRRIQKNQVWLYSEGHPWSGDP